MGLSDIATRIETAACDCGRNPNDITLIAVSKMQPPERVEAVLDEDWRIFGENRVQEAASKWPDYRARYDGIDLHLIGPLQSNKTRQAMELFDAIHTVDRPKLARAIARIGAEIERCPKLFVQVNTGDEDQKAGVSVADAPDLIALCRELDLPLVGLMCIPPVDANPVPHFETLAAMAREHGLDQLSMGMSGDFEAAIAAGATHVRVGSAIFGERDYG